ncbi:MAG: hypothetical protein EOO08_14285 [Chitinophagaceae bacterium]|nr:MAG: hypothetical protein EOO08_14285 [Chitinophagaceae bacterium]
MKKLMILAALFGAAFTLHAQKSKNGKSSALPAVSTAAALPYVATYSTQLHPGNAAYGIVVLNAWKDYDDNAIERSESIFTDNLQLHTSDGKVFSGKEDAIRSIKDFRARFAKTASSVATWTVFKSTEHPDEQMVAIWGSETDTYADGKVEKFNIHELWYFNSEGKVFMIRTFLQKVPAN